MSALRTRLSLVIGSVMLLIGGFVALRPLWDPRPVTGQRFLDLAFALFFLLRGWLYVRSVLRRPGAAPPGAPPAGGR